MKARHTVQQDIIYDALCCLRNHPTADRIYEQVHERHPNISKATVYRVLNRLSAQGAVLRIPVADGADHYDHLTHSHYHVYCEVCGRVDDVVMPDLGDLRSVVTDSCGYELNGLTLLFTGRCPDCRK